MNIYIPDNLFNLPIVEKAVELLNQFNTDYSSWGIVNDSDNELDPVKNFLYLYYENLEDDYEDEDLDEEDYDEDSEYEDEEDDIEVDEDEEEEFIETNVYPNLGTYMTDIDGVVNYIAENFYMVKGTPMVLVLLKRYGYLSPSCTYSYDGRSLNLRIEADTADLVDLYSSSIFISRLKDFLNTLLYFEKLEIKLASITIKLEYNSEKAGIVLPEHKYYQIKYYTEDD